MKIVDLRCAVIGRHPIVRIVTDENIHGLGEVEFTKPYLKPWVLHFRDALIGEDPTDVERCMLKIRQRGSFLAVHTPPSSGGAFSRSSKRARTWAPAPSPPRLFPTAGR